MTKSPPPIQRHTSPRYSNELVDPLLPPRDPSSGDIEAPAEDETAPATEIPVLTARRRARILDRDAAFCQSRGRWRVENISRDAVLHHYLPEGGRRRSRLAKRVWDDWFYTLAYQRTVVLMMILFFSYAFMVFVFGFIYLGVSYFGQQQKINADGSITNLPFCDMDINNHMEALYFSLSTMTTIGYGVSDYYFGGCWTPLILVLCQVCCAITFDAVAIGLLFMRISRGHKRAKTILLSDKAIVRRVRGSLYLMFRLGELRNEHLLEASVRAYCVRHERYQERPNRIMTAYYVTKPLKLSQDLVLMSLPQVLVHKIDSSSPLYPGEQWYDRNYYIHKQEDSEEYLSELDNMQRFLQDRDTEIIVLVEGTDELTGAAIQTRHSYTYHDLMWNHSFISCVLPIHDSSIAPSRHDERQRMSRPTLTVDFAKFHDTEPAPLDSEDCAYITYG